MLPTVTLLQCVLKLTSVQVTAEETYHIFLEETLLCLLWLSVILLRQFKGCIGTTFKQVDSLRDLSLYPLQKNLSPFLALHSIVRLIATSKGILTRPHHRTCF